MNDSAAEGPKNQHTVLVIDDEGAIREVLVRILRKNGYHPVDSADGRTGIEDFRRERPSAVLLDLKMPGMDGIAVLQELRRIDETVPVIIITAYGDIPTAVEATKLGAYDFLAKPPDFDKLTVLVRRAVEARGMMTAVRKLKTEVQTSIETVLGRSRAIRAIAAQIRQVAHSDFSLIIQGETGTGKSFIARMIHDLSARARGPFVMVDVGAIPDTLMESELFGYEKGAFTGAERRKPGHFETAGAGTLFIDELQNMSPSMQGKLLAAVEQRRIRPLGGTQPLEVDIRIIGATNADIMLLVHGGKIREDLFFRLGEVIIALPPLRDRVEDIIFLAQRFIADAAEELERPVAALTDEAAAKLLSHPWPGNIRELKNVIRRAVLSCDAKEIGAEQIQFHMMGTARSSSPGTSGPVSPDEGLLNLEQVEKHTIIKALRTSSGNKTKAAALLSVDYKTLLRKIKKYGI